MSKTTITYRLLSGLLFGAGAAAAAWTVSKSLRGELHHPRNSNYRFPVIPEHQPVMKVILLGTGMPRSSVLRSKPAQAIVAGNKTFLVDCGGGTVQRLLQAGIPPERICDLFFTHHHSDHNSGFPDFFISGWTGTGSMGRGLPLSIYGPTNTKQILSKAMEFLEWDIQLRVNQVKKESAGGTVTYVEKDEGIIYQQDGMTVTVFPVDHGIVKPSVGFRFEYRGKTIVISGDTRPCENMIRYSQNADVLIHEAYSTAVSGLGLGGLHEKEKAEAMIKGIMEYHTSTLEAAEIAQKAGVKHLVFTHLMPPPPLNRKAEKQWAQGVSDIFNGKVTVGRDLMVF